MITVRHASDMGMKTLLRVNRLVRAAGKLEEAEPLQRRAVEIGEKVLGPNSPDLATWVNNLGRLLMVRYRV